MAWRLPLHFPAMGGDKRMFEQEKGWILLGETLEKKRLIRKKLAPLLFVICCLSYVCHKESERGVLIIQRKDR